MKSLKLIILSAVLFAFASCDKVSFTGILIGNTSVDDRVEMSYGYLTALQEYHRHYRLEVAEDDGSYTYLVGSDSHMIDDPGRIIEMMDTMLAANDKFCAHLGDVVDTKPEYYAILKGVMDEYKERYYKKYCNYELINGDDGGRYWVEKTEDGQYIPLDYDTQSTMMFPLYACVGNHDLTHNGWTLFADIFHTSFFQTMVLLPVTAEEQAQGIIRADRHIFLDSANGTLGQYQAKLISKDEDALVGLIEEEYGYKITFRNTFVYTHSNIFRPTSDEFASTYAREELYFLLDTFKRWDVNTVFLGHVHAWDERYFGGVHYVTLDAMSERNSPDPGEYLVRVHVGSAQDDVKISRVKMNYVSPKHKKK